MKKELGDLDYVDVACRLALLKMYTCRLRVSQSADGGKLLADFYLNFKMVDKNNYFINYDDNNNSSQNVIENNPPVINANFNSEQNNPGMCYRILCWDAQDRVSMTIMNLQHLMLEVDQLRILSEIPKGVLEKIHYINISNNKLKGDELSFIYDLPLSKLRRLDIASNQITSLGLHNKDRLRVIWPELIRLHLENNALSSESITDEISGYFSYIHGLYLTKNNLISIGRWEGMKFKNICFLFLDDNHLDDNALIVLETIEMPYLSVLSLSKNKFTVDGIKQLSWRRFNLLALYLNDTGLDNACASVFADNYSYYGAMPALCPTLSILDLRNNNITDDGFKFFLDKNVYLPELTQLAIDENKIIFYTKSFLLDQIKRFHPSYLLKLFSSLTITAIKGRTPKPAKASELETLIYKSDQDEICDYNKGYSTSYKAKQL